MSNRGENVFTRADDGFERHYAEKIWALIPAVYRDADGRARESGQLRAIVEIIAEQAAVARRSVDRLWSDTRIDEADDWAIPYIASLLGTRLLSERNRAARRADLGATIAYRRRAGTPRLMETLADDIADWDAVASEAFRRLLRLWHSLDGEPQPGELTASPQWGRPDLRAVRIGELVDGAHDEASHYPDFRRHRGCAGRYNITKVNLHLFRHYAFPLSRVTPFDLGGGLFTLDPSGRDGSLFQAGGRDQGDCVVAREWQVRRPMTCRRLGHAAFVPERQHAPFGLADGLAAIYGRRFATEEQLLEAANAALAAHPLPPDQLADHQAAHLLAAAMHPDSTRANLLPGGSEAALSIAIAIGPQFDDAPLGRAELYAANLARWGEHHAVPGWVEALIDPARGRLRLEHHPLPVGHAVHVQRIFYGAYFGVGAGTHDRAEGLSTSGFTPVASAQPDFTVPLGGELRFMDSRTYAPAIANDEIVVDGKLKLSAANGQRPYVTLASTGAVITVRPVDADAELEIDGLWIGVLRGSGAGAATLRLEGAWRKVTLRHVTLDPGGERAAVNGQPADQIPAVRLLLVGSVTELIVDRCVTGRLEERVDAEDPCSVRDVVICDSIVRANGAEPAILMRQAFLCVDRSTVFGELVAGRLDASHVLVDGLVRVEDPQSGCFRFSAAARGGSVPHPYESTFFAPRLPAGTFVSRRFGDPGYAQLAEIAPSQLREGGEHGYEIGAFHRALDPIKRRDLLAKLDEYMPINAIPQLVFET